MPVPKTPIKNVRDTGNLQQLDVMMEEILNQRSLLSLYTSQSRVRNEAMRGTRFGLKFIPPYIFEARDWKLLNIDSFRVPTLCVSQAYESF